MDILFKYCGGCNPRIDREKLATAISQRVSSPPGGPGISPGKRKAGLKKLTVLINGCPAACGTLPPKCPGEDCLVVSGFLWEGKERREEALADVILGKIKELSRE